MVTLDSGGASNCLNYRGRNASCQAPPVHIRAGALAHLAPPSDAWRQIVLSATVGALAATALYRVGSGAPKGIGLFSISDGE